MKEAFLHYLWQFRKFEGATSSGLLLSDEQRSIQVIHPGGYNALAGPDFFNAQIRIGEQLWAGNVEVHLKSSDWYLHRHERDQAYSNVILHVVWEDDCEVFDAANLLIPTLVLSDKVSPQMLQSYKALLEAKSYRFINCESDFAEVDAALFEHWIERLYFDRLERKVSLVLGKLELVTGDWEAVLFLTLARNFGTVINADAFAELAQIIPFSIVRKLGQQPGQLEAALLGQAQMLADDPIEQQPKLWKKDYLYVKHKFELSEGIRYPMQFFKLRPPNFPGIRISQLAQLYEQHQDLFSKCIAAQTRSELQKLLKVSTSTYWETHYTFGKPHKPRIKKLSDAFIDVLIINSIIPLKFAYAQAKGLDVQEQLLDLMRSIPLEKNSIVSTFEKLKTFERDALHSQALLQLKREYCDLNQCLKCEIGNYLISN